MIVGSCSLDDFGVYTCTATNVLDTATSPCIVLSLQDEAPTVVPLSSIDIRANVSDDVTLAVTVTGWPAPQLHWTLDGVTITPPNTTSVLRISDVTVDRFGVYNCVATNTAGSTTSAGFVISHRSAAPWFDDVTVSPTKAIYGGNIEGRDTTAGRDRKQCCNYRCKAG